ncbi:zinc ribbon domain-containing protein [Methanobrevibacter sp.]|uniref:zinc ribbon domain-containing protein n=1 Tax=Methanobrevibacter sp. TaxID=66852 RepID=UPI0026DEB925|nr:zinc ribbon domain-containing protein [Methanobrevibacter sp.]MDO5859203.1 zinc ribbon domain-containing protein [Methanobrevibacter sp.]
MVKCPRCGYENSVSSKYCDNCAYLLTDQQGNRINNTKRSSSWNVGIAKKIVIVLGIIVIALLLFSFIYNNSQPSPEDSLNVITDNGTVNHSSSYPFTAVVKYDGTWYSKMGDPNYLVDQSGSGEKMFLLDCAPWERVSIMAQKEDYGDGELTIELLKNGDVVARNSTTNASGSIEINYNY